MFFSICPEMMYPRLRVERRIQKVAEHGFGYVDLWDWRDKNQAELGQQMKKYGVKLSIFCGNLDASTSIAADRRGFLKEIEASIEFARRFDCSRMIVYSDGTDLRRVRTDIFPPNFPSKPNSILEEKKVQNITQALGEATDIAEKGDVCLMLEGLNNFDHPGYFLNTSAKTLGIVRAVRNRRLKMLYDVYHMQLSEGNIIQNLGKNLPDIGYLHFADAPGRHQPGTGELNLVNILKSLKEHGYEGGLGFEYGPLGPEGRALSLVRETTLPFGK